MLLREEDVLRVMTVLGSVAGNPIYHEPTVRNGSCIWREAKALAKRMDERAYQAFVTVEVTYR